MSTADFPNSKVIGSSDNSLKIHIPLNKDGSKHKVVWIPVSQIDDDSEVYDDGENSTGTLIIPEWLAENRGLL